MKYNRLRLTVRDIRLLNDIFENQFLSFYQVLEGHFSENKRPTVYNRLSKLIRANLLEAINVNIFASHRSNELIGVIYRLTKEGVKSLQDALMTDDISFNPGTLNFANLYHDLLLIDVLRILKQRQGFVTIKASKVLDRVPDAVLFDPAKNLKVALEVELTAKSEMRYREIILSYRMSSEFEKVLYVVKEKSIQRKMGGLITGNGTRYDFGDDTDKFEFVLLEELFSSRRDVKNELRK